MPPDSIERAREHIRRARELIAYTAETTRVQDLDDQLDSIDEALRTVDRWEDEPKVRLDQIRRQLYEMETESSLEADLGDEVRHARGWVRAYQTERVGPTEPIDR